MTVVARIKTQTPGSSVSGRQWNGFQLLHWGFEAQDQQPIFKLGEVRNFDYLDRSGYSRNANFVQVTLKDEYEALMAPVWVRADYIQAVETANGQSINTNPVPTGLAILGLVGLALLFSRNK